VAGPQHLTTVETVHEDGSVLVTAEDPRGDLEEVVIVACETDESADVRAWVNTCTHEYQRLDRGGDVGAVLREGDIVCPKHGSLFDTCDGSCANGPAAGSPLVGVDVSVTHGDVYLTDDDYAFRHHGGIDDGDDGPDSTSHLRF
jgi:nitrite reductase/ring-hydroxylating ferredoxin subunit